jgi:DNA replication protein DnaC
MALVAVDRGDDLHHRRAVGLPFAPSPLQGPAPVIRQCLSDHWRSIGLLHELIEAADERRLQRLQKLLASQDLLIIDELGFVPLSKTGAELLFEVISQRYERGAIIITSNLPFDEWTEVFGSERLTGAILDRLTHHVHILEMNGESFRLRESRKAQT